MTKLARRFQSTPSLLCAEMQVRSVLNQTSMSKTGKTGILIPTPYFLFSTALELALKIVAALIAEEKKATRTQNTLRTTAARMQEQH